MIFKDAANEWFELNRKQWALNTQDMKLKLFENWIYPEIGAMDLVDIKPRHILIIFRKLESQNKTRTTRIVRQIISKVFNYSIASEYCDLNPAIAIGDALAPHLEKNHPFLQPNQLTKFFYAIEKKGRLTTQGKRAFLLTALTALRCNECLKAEWSEIDFSKKVWSIPAHRMKMRKEHVVPLTDQMIDILQMQKSEINHPTYVFPSPQDKNKPMNAWSLSRSIHHAGFGGQHVLHGFRHLFSTYCHESNKWRVDTIEVSLAHNIAGVRGVYNKAKYINERRELMTWYNNQMLIWSKDLKIKLPMR